jgi:hypothetical protein
MTNNEKFATDMRDAVKALMEADPYYSDIPIITERLQNIDAKVEQIVGKAGGLCIVLVTASFQSPIANLPGANFDTILFVARVFENVKSNPTGKEAQHVALYTAALWSQLKPDALSSPLKLDDPGVSLGNDPRFLSYDVSAVTAGGTTIEIPRLADLTIGSTPAAATPVGTFNDGTRDYSWREDDELLVLVGKEMTDPDRWEIDARSVIHPQNVTGFELALVYEHVGGLQVGYWVFERGSDGVWTINYQQIDGSTSTPPVIPDGFEFFTESVYTLDHVTPGAAKFYTLDRSFPAPRNPAAHLYLEPFNAAPGTTIRARAWLPGYIPSAELRQVI